MQLSTRGQKTPLTTEKAQEALRVSDIDNASNYDFNFLIICFIYFVKHCPQEAASSSSVDNTEESKPVSIIDILLEFFSRLISVLLYKAKSRGGRRIYK